MSCCCHCRERSRAKPDVQPLSSLTSSFVEYEDDSHLGHYLGTCVDYKASSRILLYYIHGVGSCSELWIQYVEKIISTEMNWKKNYNISIIAPDILGHGKSSVSEKLSDYSFSSICKMMLVIFDKEVASCSKAVIIGHSYGCSIAAYIAKERLTKTAGLCLIAPPAPVPLKPRDKFLEWPSACTFLIFPCLKLAFRRQAYSRPLCCASKETESVAFNIKPHVFRSIMLGQVWPTGDPDFFTSLSQSPLSFVVIHGENDRLVHPNDARLTSLLLGCKFIVVPNAGHMVPLEAFDTVDNHIRSFLSSIL